MGGACEFNVALTDGIEEACSVSSLRQSLFVVCALKYNSLYTVLPRDNDGHACSSGCTQVSFLFLNIGALGEIGANK